MFDPEQAKHKDKTETRHGTESFTHVLEDKDRKNKTHTQCAKRQLLDKNTTTRELVIVPIARPMAAP